LKDDGYDVTVANPLMVKAIAYAKVKNDKVDSTTLARLLRANMLPESYVPDGEHRELRDLVRRRHYLVCERTSFKNKIHAELSKRWIDHPNALFTGEGKAYLRSLKIDAVSDYLDVIEYLDRKIGEMDEEVKAKALEDRYARLLMTIPGIGYYAALLISSEIGSVDRFPDYGHLCSYAGLVPRLKESGGKSMHGHISKQGSSLLRWVLIQCTHVHLRYDTSISRYCHALERRRGKKIAIVASSRKLLKCVYIMLKEDRAFRLEG